MNVALWILAGLVACAGLFWLLCVPKRLRVGAAAGPERHVPPAPPLGIPLAAAVMNRLSVDCGLTPAEVHHWWSLPRHELDGFTPKQIALAGGGREVLELAERDAAYPRSQWEAIA